MSRPGRLGLGLHGVPETRVRTITVENRTPPAPTASPQPDPDDLPAVPAASGPTTRSRGKTAPSETSAPPKKKLVITLKVKSPALKKVLTKHNMIRT